MEEARKLTGVAESVHNIFIEAEDINSSVTLGRESGSEVINGLQSNGRIIKLLRPLIDFESEAETVIYTVAIYYSVVARGGLSETETMCREFFFVDGRQLEVIRQEQGEIYRELGAGEASDVADAVTNARWI